MDQNRNPESWINFSRVSRHWRSLALNALELWTNIPLEFPRWAEEMLTRSKMAKLSLQVRRFQNPRSNQIMPLPDGTPWTRLKYVQLLKCKINWLLTGLTHSTLRDSLKDNGNSSMIQFLDALKRMPALTNLDLGDSIPYDSGETSTYPVVDLPCLLTLRISSGVCAVTAALTHITFSRVTLTLTCKAAQSTQTDFSCQLRSSCHPKS